MLRKSSLMVLGFILVATSVGNAQVKERWRCFDYAAFRDNNMLVHLTGELFEGETYGYGEVSFGTISQFASFSIQGLDRRWDFGDGLEYAFIIEPNGTGAYYDFTNVNEGDTTSPSSLYRCESY